MAISDSEYELTCCGFNEPALNGSSPDPSGQRNLADNHYKILGTKLIAARRLASSLDEGLPAGQEMGYLSINAEGCDLSVLKSNNWNTYWPKVVIVEVIGQTLDTIFASEIYKFLKLLGYSVYAKCVQSVIIKERDARADSLDYTTSAA